MLPRDYLKLSGRSHQQVLDQLKELAEPGELADLSLSTVCRHFSGQYFPPARLQDLYDQATGGVVKPQDWVDLARETRADKAEKAKAA